MANTSKIHMKGYTYLLKTYLHTLVEDDSNYDWFHEDMLVLSFQLKCIQENTQMKQFVQQWSLFQWQNHSERGVGQDSFATDMLK